MRDYMQIEQVNEAITPDEMRNEILRLRRFDPITKAVMDAADYYGQSGEDRYVTLAYHALREKQRLLKVLHDHTLNFVPPSFLRSAENGQDQEGQSQP